MYLIYKLVVEQILQGQAQSNHMLEKLSGSGELMIRKFLLEYGNTQLPFQRISKQFYIAKNSLSLLALINSFPLSTCLSMFFFSFYKKLSQCYFSLGDISVILNLYTAPSGSLMSDKHPLSLHFLLNVLKSQRVDFLICYVTRSPLIAVHLTFEMLFH